MFFQLLSFFEHRLRSDVIGDFEALGFSVQDIEKDSAGRTLRVLLANRDR
jgi:hypothetical protein